PPLAEPAFGPSLRAGSRQRTRPARQSMTGDESAWLDAAPWGITPRVADRLRATAAEVAREWGVPLSQRIVGGRFSFVAFAGGDTFRWVCDPVRRWLDNAGDHYLVRQAKEIYATMHPSDATLVHGDFHHHNLLRHGDGWVVIDPKPMVGEPEFDVATLLWNPI